MEITVRARVLHQLIGRTAGITSGFLVSIVLSSILLAPATLSAAGQQTPNAATLNSWSNLKPEQKQALAPLAQDWNAMPAERQQKWLVFAEKFKKMAPADQQRAQEKMSEWVKLSPEQRLAARQNYIRSNKLQPDQRAQKWQEYQQLTDEEKMRLASRPEKKKIITNLPSPSESKEKKLQPLKKPPTPAPSAAAVKPSMPNSVSAVNPAAASASLPASSTPNPHP